MNKLYLRIWKRMHPDKVREYAHRYHLKHKKEIKEKTKKYYIKNKKRIIKRTRKWGRNNKEKMHELQRKWYLRKREKHLEKTKKNYFEKKKIIFEHYSKGTNACACCGITDLRFLTIDHVNGEGRKHRKEIGMSSFYDWLIRNNMPNKPPLQVLCYNCNLAKAKNNNICPHKDKM